MGIVTFEPESNFHGTVQLGYRVCFANGSCTDGVITVVVGPDNDAPVAQPDQVTIPEDTSAVLEVLNNDSDGDVVFDNTLLDVSGITAPQGTITLKDNTIKLNDASDLGDFEFRLLDNVGC